MTPYSFTTLWRVHAPIEPVLDALARAEAYPSGWKSMTRVEQITAGDSNGIGRTYRSFWRTHLPHTFAFETRTRRVVVPTLIEMQARAS